MKKLMGYLAQNGLVIIQGLMIPVALTAMAWQYLTWPFGKVPDEILAMARASCSGTFTTENCDHFVNKAGKTYVEPSNQYTKMIGGEKWDCAEIKAYFISPELDKCYNSYSEWKKYPERQKNGFRGERSIRVASIEMAYIKRGNRYDVKYLSPVKFHIDEWEYANTPSLALCGRSALLGALENYCTDKKISSSIRRGDINAGSIEMTNSPQYPLQIKVTFRTADSLTERGPVIILFSSKDEEWTSYK